MVNEFRQDIVSGDWVLISTERAKKPTLPISQEAIKHSQLYQDKETCLFEDPQRSDHRDPILIYNKGQKVVWEKGVTGEWTTQVVKNKYPALMMDFVSHLEMSVHFWLQMVLGFTSLLSPATTTKVLLNLRTKRLQKLLRFIRIGIILYLEMGAVIMF